MRGYIDDLVNRATTILRSRGYIVDPVLLQKQISTRILDGTLDNLDIAIDAYIEDIQVVGFEPQCCPYCGGKNLTTFMVRWDAQSIEDKDNQSVLDEHQCNICVRSFWT